MSFDPTPFLTKIKGGALYLPVKDRLQWLREDYPDADIETEMVHMDSEQGLYIFRAKVSIPEHGSATGFGSETERDFPAGPIEKAETKAIGRALGALGMGTQFALEFDEGERVVDSPVTPRPSKLKVDLEELRSEVSAALSVDTDAASKLPKPAAKMDGAELEKTLAWLRNRAKRSAS